MQSHLQVIFEEPFHGTGVGFFISTVYGNGNCIALPDIQSHNRKDPGGKSGFVPNFPDSNGAVKGFSGSDQQSGVTGMNAHRNGDGILKACHKDTSFPETHVVAGAHGKSKSIILRSNSSAFAMAECYHVVFLPSSNKVNKIFRISVKYFYSHLPFI